MLHHGRRFHADGLFTISFPGRLRFTIGRRLLHDRCRVFHHVLRGPLFHHCGLNVIANRGGLAIVPIAGRAALAVAIATTGLLAARLLIGIFLSLGTTATTTTPATATFFARAFGPLVPGRTLTRLTLLYCRQRLLLVLGTLGPRRTIRTRWPLLTVMLLALSAAFLIAIATLPAIAAFTFRAWAFIAVFAATAAAFTTTVGT